MVNLSQVRRILGDRSLERGREVMPKQTTTKHRRNSRTKSAGRLISSGNGKREAATGLSKVTLYVRPDQVVGVESIQLSERKRTGQRRDKSSLVQEALDLLISKYKRKQ